MGVTESKENYLEIIHILASKQKEVHAIDIANYLGFARASVSIALKALKDELKNIKTYVAEKIDNIEKDNKKLEEKDKDILRRIELLEKENKELRRKVELLQK